MKHIHILKTQGTSKLPDYIQIRDEQLVLLTHSRADKPKNAIESVGLGEYLEKIETLISQMPYGEMQKFDL